MQLMQSKTALFLFLLLALELVARALAGAGLITAADVESLHESLLLFGGGFVVKESVTNHASRGATSGYAQGKIQPGGPS